MARKKFSSVDEYILASPPEVRSILEKIRTEIKHRVPSAKETIAYNMPAFRDLKVFIYFAGFKKHIGVYPPVRDTRLRRKLKSFANEKGNVAFQLDQEIPIELIGDMAQALWNQHKS